MSAVSIFIIQNKTQLTFEGHVEPECRMFSIAPGQSLMVRGSYEFEPPTIQLADNEGGLPFLALFPGDGEVAAIHAE